MLHEPPSLDALWARFLAGRDDPTRALLIERHLYLVGRIIGSMRPPIVPRAEIGDAESVGMIALVKAVDEYDPTRGQFAPFAAGRIRWAILDLLQRESFYPLHVYRLERRVRRITGCSPEQLKIPQMDKLAATLLIDIDQVYELRLLLLRGAVLSIEEVEPVADGSGPEDLARQEIIRARVILAIEALEEPDRTVIRECCLDGQTLTAVARSIGGSRQRVSLIRSRALSALGQALTRDLEFIAAGGRE